MSVWVQNIESRLYLAYEGRWVKLKDQPLVFRDAMAAITFCIEHHLRTVRLVGKADDAGNETYLYPFGQDPTVKAQLKQLRKSIAESRRLQQEKRTLVARMDLLRAESKERKKQVPFKRKAVAEE